MRVIAMIVLVAVAVAGCTAPAESPTATSQVQQQATTAPSAGLGELPPVPRTLAMDKYLVNPCALLGQADFEALGFAGQFAPVPGNDQKQPMCEVGGGSGGGMLQVRIWPDVQPLREIYAGQPGEFEFLHPVDLAGMPAVVRAVSVRHAGDCEVTVATGREQGIRLSHWPSTRQGGTVGICGRLTTVAETLLNKLGA